MNPSSGSDRSTVPEPVDQQAVQFAALDTAGKFGGTLDSDIMTTQSLIDIEHTDAEKLTLERKAKKTRLIVVKLLAIIMVMVVGVIFLLMSHGKSGVTNSATQADASQRFNPTTIAVGGISGGGLSLQNGQTLSINGQLNVNNSLVLAPTSRPDGAVVGQLYYDQASNQLAYYNGKQFVNVLSGSLPTQTPSVTVNGTAGDLSTGTGLTLSNKTLSNTGVLTLQGESGNVSLTSGGGLLISGTTLTNSGLLSLGGQHGDIAVGSGLNVTGGTLTNSGIISATGAGTITVTNDGHGNIVIDGPNSGGGGSGTVASPGGTIGKIAKFTGVQTIADSLLSDNGSKVTVAGDLHVTGMLNLDSALSVTSGGTGATTATGARTALNAAKSGANSDITSLSGLTTALTVAQGGTGVGTLSTNGVIIGNGTSGLTSVVAGASGLCLTSTAGAPVFTTCPGSGGVSSLNGLNGALTIANSTGSGTTITINDATNSAKGIASFNATNFLVTSGTVTTVQDIAVNSTPTFAGLTLTNPLGVASGGTGRSTLTSGGVLIGNGSSAITSTTGTNGQCLVVNSSGTPVFITCPGSGGVTNVNSANGAITIQGTAGSSVSTVGSTITINDATNSVKGLASFNSTNFSVSGGSVNTVQDISTISAPQFGQLSIVGGQTTGTMLKVNNTNALATGNLLDLQLNGSSKLSVAANGNLTTNGTITSGLVNGQTIGSSTSFTGSVAVAGTLNVNTIAPTTALTVGVGSQTFTLQGNTSSTLTATNGTNTTTVGFQSPTANVTYNFAAATAGNYTICTTAGNCAGVGGGVTTPGGTTNKLAKFTAGSTLGDSSISDDGTTVTIGANLSVNTISPSAALTVGVNGQNLTLQGASVSLKSTAGGITNSLIFSTPSSSNKTITLPNASGTVAVSASGPLSLDSSGNLTCPTCLTSGGGGGSFGVTSVNGLSGALLLQGSDSNTFTSSGTTITVHDATSLIKGVASFNATNLIVTNGNVNTVQDIAVTSTPTFAGLNLTSALSVVNGGTGAATAAGARANLGVAASGANNDITSLTGLTTALSVVQGGTGVATTPNSGQILIGNGSGYSLNTLTAGSGVTIDNSNPGHITISASGAGTCAGCANTSLNNLSSVAINTTLLPGAAGGANLGSSSLPFGQLFLSGTSASPASNNFKITGSATGARTITLPDASGTVAVSASGYLNLSASGNLTFSGTLAVGDGGTGATTAGGARTNLGAAASGANSDIISLSGLTTALSVGQGGTGLSSLIANQLLFASNSSTISQLSSGVSGNCLVSNGSSSAPSFQACPGSGGVSTLNSLSGALTINNTTGSGSTITINSAAANGITKGIATFNSSNFTDNGSGVINTIQGIATTSTPTFAGLTVNGTLNATSLSTNTITPTGAMVIGATNQSLTLQGNASSVITATGGGFSTTIGFAGTPTGNTIYQFDRAAAGGTYSICTTAGNCVGIGGAVTTSGGTANTLAMFTGSGTIANSLLTQNNGTSTVSVAGNFAATGSISSASGFIVNGTSGSTTTCTGGQFLQNQVIQGGIITGGTCIGAAAGGATTVGALDGGTANANGATITGSNLYLQSASTSYSGLVNTTTQSFAGNKTFTGNVAVGTSGTPTGQLYVSGGTSTFVSKNSDTNLNNPQSMAMFGHYMIVANYSANKIASYDVASGTPVYVGQNSDSNATTANSIAISGHYAYVTTALNNKLVVYDVASGTPVYVGQNSDSNISNGDFVTTQGRYAFVSNRASGKITTYDISGIVPVYVGQNSDSNLSTPEGITVSGRYAFVASRGNNKIVSYDISNGTPVYVGQNSDANLNTPYRLAISGGYAFVPSSGSNKLVVYNISSGTPVYVGQNSDANLSTPWAVQVAGRYAYVSNTGAPAKILTYDLSSGTPVYVGQNSDSNAAGVTDISIQGRFMYVLAAGQYKVDIYDLGGTYSQQLESGAGQFGQLAVDGNSILNGNVNIQGGLTIGQSTGINGSLGVAGSVSFRNLTNSSAAFVVQNASSATVFGVDTTNNQVILGTQNSVNGSIKFNSASGTGSVTLSLANPGSTNYTLSIPTLTANDTICTIGTGCGTQGVTTVGALDGGTANVKGATISGATLYLQSASTSYSGLVNTTTQSFAGNKTFTGSITANGSGFDTSGNLGVGTTTPGANLDIQSGATTGNAVNITTNSLTTGSALNISSLPATSSAGNLINGSQSGTVTANASINGSLVNLNRNLTVNVPGGAPAITLDSQVTAPVNSSTWNHTVANQPNRLLLVTCSGSGVNITSASYNGVAMTLVASANNGGGYTSRIFKLINPATGTHAVTFSGGSGTCQYTGSTSWYNVDQTTGIGTFATNSGTGTTLTTSITSTSNQVILDAATSDNGTFTAGLGQTTLYAFTYGGSSYKAASAGSTTMSWSGGGTNKATVLVNILPAAGAPTVAISGALANFTSNCSVTAGICTDNSTILSLNQQYASATGAVASIQNAGSGDMIDFLNGVGTVVTSVSSGGNIFTSGSGTFKTTSTTALSIQNSSGTSYFNVDTSTGTITLGNIASGNYISFTASGGITSYGTAQHTKAINLTAEYAGAVLNSSSDSVCSSANSGFMTSGYDATNAMSYYDWTSTAAAQCYDVVVRITLPNDFNGWTSSTPLSFKTYTTSTSTGLLNIDLHDTTNTSVTGCAYTNATPGTILTWTNTGSPCSFSGGTYTAGGTITLRIRMTAGTTDDVRAGDLVLNYNSKY